MKIRLPAILSGLALGFAASAAAAADADVGSQAHGSDFFSLGPPAIARSDDGVRLSGRVCRLRRSTLLAPQEIRIEHLGPDGRVLDTVHARSPAINRSWDQACRTYSRRVPWTLAAGDMVVVCFEHGRPCPAAGQSRTAAVEPAGAPPATARR